MKVCSADGCGTLGESGCVCCESFSLKGDQSGFRPDYGHVYTYTSGPSLHLQERMVGSCQPNQSQQFEQKDSPTVSNRGPEGLTNRPGSSGEQGGQSQQPHNNLNPPNNL